ncbi:YesL family protein [Proteiniclasticum sp.]|uniref:YesL family protein n=1 Tax=Proteiniclasticum sp. TaxID=2053595 RepID=UPI00289FCA49|nr:YesL family protein [Proteiniclasticum sp.]
MFEIFHPESRFMEMLGRITDMMLLNVLFIITSLPVVTIGASSAALYSVTLKLSREEDVYPLREYLSSFRSNFRKPTVLWLILSAVGMLLAAETALLLLVDSGIKYPLLIIQGGLLLFYLTTFFTAIPLAAEATEGEMEILKTALTLPFYSLPEVMGVLAVNVVPVLFTGYLFLFLPNIFMVWGFIGFSCIAYASSFFMNRVLKKRE